jgi:hypothetical protein
MNKKGTVMSKTKTITAVFDSSVEAETALRKLEHAGFIQSEITILLSEETRGKHFGIKEGTKAESGAAAGAAIGGVSGALWLALASAGTLLIPGLNLVVSGALIGGLVGLGAGAATGGLVGSLVGVGIPEHEAKLYEDAVRKGAVLVAVESSDDDCTDRIKGILKGANAQNITAQAA